MLKRANIDIIGPKAKRFKIIRVSQKQAVPAGNAVSGSSFDTSRFVQGLNFSAKSEEDLKIVSNEAESSEVNADLSEASLASNIFDGEVVDTSKNCFSAGPDLVVELDCETVEMMNEDVVSDGVVDSETFPSSSTTTFCLSHETQVGHQNHDEDEEESRHESNPFMSQFDGGTSEALELISNGVVFTDGVIKVELPDITDTFQSDSCLDEAIIEQAMDITEPLTTLKQLLEERLGFSLGAHEVWLQDSLKLDQNKNLVSQCLEGTGVVQINVEIKSIEGQNPRLNIVDVLKPVDEDEEEDEEVVNGDDDNNQSAHEPVVLNGVASSSLSSSSTSITKWVVDSWFCAEQEKMKMSRDPALWSVDNVKFWLHWAIKKFSLESVNSYLMEGVDGSKLISLTHDSFAQIFPNDPGDVFWTHLELLRKCKFVAVMLNETLTLASSNSNNKTASRSTRVHNRTRNIRLSASGGGDKSSISRFGNNGQIQLWQFLLELLTDKEYRNSIQWVGDNGEFKLVNPEYIAQLWGRRKNKANMNYEKLSRALRYYYDGDMIAKVHGKRFTYKYVCDLRTLLGYSAAELNQLVNECAKKSTGNSFQGTSFLQTQIL